MLFVAMGPDEEGTLHGADLVTLRGETGELVTARMIGPVAGDAMNAPRWRIARRYRIDPGGEPLSALGSESPAPESDAVGHDWGALGLPDGLETCVLPVGEPTTTGEAALAHASNGHRFGEATWWLTIAPGDRVAIDHNLAMVVAIDRRKRTVEVEIDGEASIVPLDDLRPAPV